MGKNGPRRERRRSLVKHEPTTLKLNYDPSLGKPQKMIKLDGKMKTPLNVEDDREGVEQAIFWVDQMGPVLAETTDGGKHWAAVAMLVEEPGSDEEE